VYAVDDVSFSVDRGEVFGFLGPNGAGKSTTIDVIMDYVRPTAGSATVLGYDAQADAQAVHERVGILPDAYSLYDRLTARQHVAFASDLKGADVDADALLDRVGIAHAAERRAGGYSKGMRQRLALAMALVGDPEVLVLDEPSSGLDPDGIRDVREITRQHARDGGTVFFSSHVLSQVEAVCDRVGILDDGRLVTVDTIDGLRDAVGTGSTVTLTVDTPPNELQVDDIEGLVDVTVTDDAVRGTCIEPAAKLAFIDRVRATGCAVLDVEIADPSLEELFAAYTHGNPPSGSKQQRSGETESTRRDEGNGGGAA
jgi:ABC-2 type transport system ATP-binding protein